VFSFGDEITTNKVVGFQAAGWSDAASGIDKIEFDFCQMHVTAVANGGLLDWNPRTCVRVEKPGYDTGRVDYSLPVGIVSVSGDVLGSVW
jgi:hypothetical protein